MQAANQISMPRAADSAELSTRAVAAHGAVPLRRRVGQRVFDVSVAVAALLVMSPLMVAIAVAVKISSPGPIIYRSRRYAFGGQRFGMLKFRTMVTADRQRELMNADPQANAHMSREFKLKDDPRVTTIGRLLRRTSLDELPQLINVVRGDMSIVGPRPKLEDEGTRYGGLLDLVLSVPPGITGSWQTSGRNDLPFERRIDLDVEYVIGRSFTWDLKICARTVAQLLSPKRHGAY
ncbi:MAG: sugar transferase [Actinomycetota bacterium]